MEKDLLIKIRTTLKAGKDLPIKVFIDNNFCIFDESAPLQFTIWDDDNEILYSFRLPHAYDYNLPSNSKEKVVNVTATSYEQIQYMTLASTGIKNIPDIINAIRANGKDIAAEYEQIIIDTFKLINNSNKPEVSYADINKTIKSNDALPIGDDYYAGRFTENFQETVPVKLSNESLEVDKN